jgi:hypothetical protein
VDAFAPWHPLLQVLLPSNGEPVKPGGPALVLPSAVDEYSVVKIDAMAIAKIDRATLVVLLFIIKSF